MLVKIFILGITLEIRIDLASLCSAQKEKKRQKMYKKVPFSMKKLWFKISCFPKSNSMLPWDLRKIRFSQLFLPRPKFDIFHWLFLLFHGWFNATTNKTEHSFYHYPLAKAIVSYCAMTQYNEWQLRPQLDSIRFVWRSGQCLAVSHTATNKL